MAWIGGMTVWQNENLKIVYAYLISELMQKWGNHIKAPAIITNQ